MTDRPIPEKRGGIGQRRAFFYVYLCFFASGATGLIYEILWTRHLSLIFGHTVLAISTVLSVFMAGLATGSYLCGRFVDRPENLRKLLPGSRYPALVLYGVLEGIIGLYALITPVLFSLIRESYVRLSSHFGLGFSALSLSCFAASFLALLLPTTCMRATVGTIKIGIFLNLALGLVILLFRYREFWVSASAAASRSTPQGNTRRQKASRLWRSSLR